MTTEADLQKAFKAYLDLARAKLRPQQLKTLSPIPLELLRSESAELEHLVSVIEKSREFAELLKQTETLFPVEKGRAYMRATQTSELPVFGELTKISDHDFNRIQNFFRRSRCYTSLYNDQKVDAGTEYQNFLQEIRKQQIRIQYLVPFYSINFGVERMEFDRFQIRRFSAEELNEIVQNDIREVFYPQYTADLAEIEAYWFLVIEEFVEAASYRVNKFPLAQQFSPPVQEELSTLPSAIERVLESFILCDWDSLAESEPLEESTRFEIPFVLEIADDLLYPLDSIPEMSPLGGPLSQDTVTGAYSYDVEYYDYEVVMTADRAASFQSFVARANSILTHLRSTERSALVHGREELLDPKATYAHFREARNLARETVVGFLRYLDHVRAKTSIESLPTREELLSVLEEVEIEKRERLIESNVRVNQLLKILPADSPQPSSWFEDTN